MVPPLTAGEAIAAARRGEWSDAYDALVVVDEDSLDAEHLEAKADAAWWTSRLPESMRVRAVAYKAYADRGDDHRAAYNAWFLSFDLALKGERAQAAAWLARARRHVEEDPDCYERGLIAIRESDAAHAKGDLDEALRFAEQARTVAAACESVDLAALAMQSLGALRIESGDAGEGTRLLDEAMSSVVAGETSPMVTGWIYCNVMGACIRIADLRRAGEWAEAARRWTESLQASTPYHGLCRIYRVEVSALRGELENAEGEAERAGEELLAYEPSVAGFAFAALGEIRRRRGDLAGAEDALLRAHELGHDPQPSLALIRLALGKPNVAATSLLSALHESNDRSLARARTLAACTDVMLAAGDEAAARRAVALLRDIADDGGVLDAYAHLAEGTFWLATADEAAAESLKRAFRLWQDLKMPYEAARTRMLLGDALKASGDDEGAALEWKAAAASFERLGAVLDAEDATMRLMPKKDRPDGLTDREVEVLRLVAAGKTNKQIASMLVISEHTVGRHVQNIFGKLGVSTRAAATAYAFEHHLVV